MIRNVKGECKVRAAVGSEQVVQSTDTNSEEAPPTSQILLICMDDFLTDGTRISWSNKINVLQ